MKYILSILLFTLFLNSCNKKTVLLAETTNTDITEVLDVSPVYLFYDESQPNSTEFNHKNMISTTNWLVNIDKRLTLKQILPHLQYLQDKRHGDGMHKNESAKNYFTCSNTDIQNLAFIEFTDIYYEDNGKMKLPNEMRPKGDWHLLNIFSNEVFRLNDKINLSIQNLIENLKTEIELGEILYLRFNENINFQTYIQLKTELLKTNALTISNHELIYN